MLKTPTNPGGRVSVGDAILTSAKQAKTTAIKKRLAAFTAAHRAYVKAHDAADSASERLAAQQRAIAESDVAQDAAVEALAASCAGDGLPRANPFAALGFHAPSVIQAMGYATEAKVVRALATAVRRHPLASPRTRDAANASEKLARAVEAEIAKIAPLARAHAAAITEREALAQDWETTLAALKRGALAAEDDEGKGLVARLFGGPKPKGKRKPAKPKLSAPKAPGA